MGNLLSPVFFSGLVILRNTNYMWLVNFTEGASADDKRGKLYKPKPRFETKSILPLETPPQFLALDKRNVCSIRQSVYCFCVYYKCIYFYLACLCVIDLYVIN